MATPVEYFEHTKDRQQRALKALGHGASPASRSSARAVAASTRTTASPAASRATKRRSSAT